AGHTACGPADHHGELAFVVHELHVSGPGGARAVTGDGVRSLQEHQRFLLWGECELAGVLRVVEPDGKDRPRLDRRQPGDFLLGHAPAVIEAQALAFGRCRMTIATEDHARPSHEGISAASESSGTSAFSSRPRPSISTVIRSPARASAGCSGTPTASRSPARSVMNSVMSAIRAAMSRCRLAVVFCILSSPLTQARM